MSEEKKDAPPPAKVTRLQDHRHKKAEKEVKLKTAELYLALADAVNRSPLSILPPFPHTYYVVEQVGGVRVVAVPREDGSLETVIPEMVVNSLMRYMATTLAGRPEFAMTHRQGVEAVATWMAVTDPLKDVPYTRWLSERGHCWRRIPFDLVPNPEGSLTPTWDGLLSRVSDQAALKSLVVWIGSLFFKESYRQQYVWIYGSGGNGKGAITRFLHKVFGGAAHFLSNIPREPNQFWTAQLLDRRLVVVPDCENAKFPSSGLFKTLSGDDPITIERKREAPFTAVLDGKFLFTSNRMPEVSSEAADIRRAIFVELGGGGTWDADFEKKLWAEGGAFLWDCITAYQAVCPDHCPIPVGDNENLLGWVSSIEETEEVIFDKWFEISPDDFVVPGDMKGILDIEWPHRRKPQMAFLEWLRRKHGVYKIRARVEFDGRQNRYQGIKMKIPLSSAKRSFYDPQE